MGGSERSAVRTAKKSVGLITYFTCDRDLRFPALPDRCALRALSEQAGHLLRKREVGNIAQHSHGARIG